MKQVIVLWFLLFGFYIYAQAPKKFYLRFGGNGYDYAYDVKQTLDKGYIITGSTSSFGQGNTDLYLIKLDSMGQKKFETSFGSYNNDIGKSVIQLQDSGYVIAGYTNSTGFGGYDLYLVKADKNGNLVWEKTIGGTDWDFANSIQQTSDGGFIISGTTYSYGYGNADGYILKTDASGNILWSKTYGGKKDDEFKSVIQTLDGGFALTGYTKSYNDTVYGDGWIFKLDALGDSTWCQFYGGSQEDFGNQIIENSGGDYFIAAATQSFGSGLLDAYALRTDNNGNVLWHLEDGFSGSNESFNSVTIAKRNQNYIVFTETETFPGFGVQIKIFEMTASGYYNFATEYGGVNADELYKIVSTNDKGYVGVGYTTNFGATLTDGFILKLDTTMLASPSIVAIDEHNRPIGHLNVYPNPTSDIFNIISEISVNTSNFRLFDLIGTEITTTDMASNQTDKHIVIDCRGLPKGIYILKYGNSTHKVIISK